MIMCTRVKHLSLVIAEIEGFFPLHLSGDNFVITTVFQLVRFHPFIDHECP